MNRGLVKPYMVVEADSIEELSEKVGDFMGLGYTPLGGLQVVTTCISDKRYGGEYEVTTFYQAMVRVKAVFDGEF